MTVDDIDTICQKLKKEWEQYIKQSYDMVKSIAKEDTKGITVALPVTLQK